MEPVVIIAVIGVISFINWLVRQSQEARHRKAEEERRMRGDTAEEAPAISPPPVPVRPHAQEEQMRKFLEALGLPADETPPVIAPLPIPKLAEPPPLPQVAPARRPIVEQPAPVAARAELSQPIFTTRTPTRSPEIAAAAARFATATSTGARTDDYRFHFQDKAHALRDAIVMREILGRPKAFEYGV